ncbi:MAG: 3-deoxy-7-phosphoheptulonate synthase [Clostridia bacterium]|nr:3-deoxy-7-phosphoheptulonate synthase [Clostridia bacterium]MCI2015731.1 3-deoxy-7-phosphoheptulonate synthase [Clostridia bacterium]
MILVMKQNATEENIKKIIETVHSCGLKTHLSTGESLTIIGVIGDKKKLLEKNPGLFPGVERIIQVSESYKLANKKFKAEPSVYDIDGVKIGGDNFCMIAGPCAIESKEQILEAAQCVKKAGANILRGGAYKPRTSPYSFQGLEEKGLEYMKEAGEKTGLKIVSEVTSIEALNTAKDYVDILQIGARNMQNFELLKAAGKADIPVILKRGLCATIDEWLNAAEYIMSEGNERVILCERGIRTFETSTRNTLDISAVPVLKSKTHLPVIIDPSHASGVREYIAPLSRAAVAAGSDGLIIEVHPHPECALSDGAQSLNPTDFENLCAELKPFISLMGRK